LGLSLVQWIVQQHMGRVEVQSEPGKGSRFAICLPGDPGA
jgi:signal transduction histidine kinase